MSRRWKFLIAGLWISVIALWLLLPRLGQRPEAAAVATRPLPTWTTTPIRLVVAPKAAPAQATPAVAEDAAPAATPDLTSTPPPAAPLDVEADIPDRPTPAPAATATPPPPTPPPPAIAADGRIDAIGPIVLPTVEPLNFGAGRAPARLRIPILGLDTEVKPMGWHVVEDENGTRSEWDVVDFAAGHHINTAYPGEAGNIVISGHNNIGGSVFRSVCVIGEPGVAFGLEDEMILIDEIGRQFTYQVNGWQRMEERNASIATRVENARWMDPTPYAQLTLVTCWPPWSNTHRVVVTGALTGMNLNP